MYILWSVVFAFMCQWKSIHEREKDADVKNYFVISNKNFTHISQRIACHQSWIINKKYTNLFICRDCQWANREKHFIQRGSRRKIYGCSSHIKEKNDEEEIEIASHCSKSRNHLMKRIIASVLLLLLAAYMMKWSRWLRFKANDNRKVTLHSLSIASYTLLWCIDALSCDTYSQLFFLQPTHNCIVKLWVF